MKLGLISDTHMPGAAPENPPQLIKAFEGVDMILHLGDIYGSSCLDWLEGIAPVVAVEFNNSGLVETDPRVKIKRVLELEGHRIGMVHEFYLPGLHGDVFTGEIERLFPKDLSMSAALEEFYGAPVDIALFGHTHDHMVEEHQGVLFVNPGSPTLPRHSRRLGTVGILELNNGARSARIINLAELGE